MSRIEDRLRDALAAEATRLEPRPDAWAEQRRRVAARRANRSRSLAAAAALVVLAGVAVLAARDRGAGLTVPAPSAPHSASPTTAAAAAAPRWYVAVTADGAQATVRNSATGAQVARVDRTADYAGFTAVEAGRPVGVYYTAERARTGCAGSVTKHTYRARTGATTTQGLPGGSTLPGEVTDLAVSPAGDMLAMVVRRTPSPSGGDHCIQAELWVRDLRTGRTTVWTGPSHGGEPDGLGDTLHHLSFSPDGRRLAYEAAGCCGDRDTGFYVLDLAAPGRDYLGARRVGDPDPGCALLLPSHRVGDLVAVRDCAGGGGPESSLVVLDPVTFAVRRTLGPVPWPERLDASPGGHLLLTDEEGRVLRVAPDGAAHVVQTGTGIAAW